MPKTIKQKIMRIITETNRVRSIYEPQTKTKKVRSAYVLSDTHTHDALNESEEKPKRQHIPTHDT